MALFRTEAVVLQAQNFQDYDKILTCFAKDHGLIKLIVKQGNRIQHGLALSMAPLTHVEIVFQQGKSDLLKCQEFNLLDAHLHLRKSFALMDAGCSMAQALLATQMPNYSAPALFRLFAIYLCHLAKVSSPVLLTSSFKLKLLRHDGLFPTDEILYEQFGQDAEKVQLLAFSRSFEEIERLDIAEALHDQISQLYLRLICN